MTRVLITGAAGGIGRVLRAGLKGRYPVLRLGDVAPLGEAGPGEELVHVDIRDPLALDAAMTGIDAVVHLAGIAEEDRWERIRDINIDGTFQVFDAARRAGVGRVVFASSNHAVGFYRRARPLDERVMVRPDTRYGVSKAFGEALGRLYADKHGLSVACLRIGSFRARPQGYRQLITWLSHADMVELARCCIEAPAYHFVVLYGISNNARAKWWSADARRVGYVPRDDAEAFAAEILAAGEAEPALAAAFHGGPYCPMEFSGDPDRIE